MMRPLNPWKLSGYKAGQNVICKVGRAEPGGYSVVITKDNLPAFLPTQAVLRTNEEVLAQFVCVHNNRILLSARFSTTPSGNPVQSVRWEDYLSEINSKTSDSVAIEQEVSQPEETPVAKPFGEPQMEEDMAFRVWAQTAPQVVHLKRAIDLILPPAQTKTDQTFKTADYDLEWLTTDLEGGMRTCSVKAISEEVPSRSAMLVYKGRAVGATYTSIKRPDPPATEESLQLMFDDLSLANTTVSIYDLPESLALSMSALFMGYPVKRADTYGGLPYFEYICGWLANKGQTACLAITLVARAGNCFVYIYKGQFVGAYYIDEQVFTNDKEFVVNLLTNDKEASVEACILPPEMTSSAVRFGFSLSMTKAKRAGN